MTTQYFPHDYHARHDPKLLALRRRHGLAGLGAYWCLVEFIYEQGGSLGQPELEDLAYDLRLDVADLAAIVYDFDLFQVAGDRITCAAVTERLQLRADKTQKAQKSAKKRWSHANAMPTHSQRTTAQQSPSTAEALHLKESKEKESKIDSKLTNNAPEGVVSENPTPSKSKKAKKSEKSTGPDLSPFLAPLASPRLAAAWTAFQDSRKRLRAPNSPYALNLVVGKLQHLRPDDPEGWADLLEIAVERGWRSVFEPRDTTHPKPQHHDPKPTLAQKYNAHAADLAQKWGLT